MARVLNRVSTAWRPRLPISPARSRLRVIRSMIPELDLELYNLRLAGRENGQRGEPGTLHPLSDYAQRQRIGLSAVYFRMQRLAQPPGPGLRRLGLTLRRWPPRSCAGTARA